MGGIVCLFASFAPSLIMMIAILGLFMKFKDSPQVKKLTQYVRPTIAVLLGVMTYSFFFSSYEDAGAIHTIIIALASYLMLAKWKLSPVYVVLGALVYGATFIG